jgi:hypothetical protein
VPTYRCSSSSTAARRSARPSADSGHRDRLDRRIVIARIGDPSADAGQSATVPSKSLSARPMVPRGGDRVVLRNRKPLRPRRRHRQRPVDSQGALLRTSPKHSTRWWPW